MPVLSLACHLPHNTPHIPSRYNNEQTTKQTKAINNSYIYIYISHVNVTQTVPDISPLMPMHQDPLLVNLLRPSDTDTRYESTAIHHWFRWWLVAWSAPSHYLYQCWKLSIVLSGRKLISGKRFWTCRLRNVGHFVSASKCYQTGVLVLKSYLPVYKHVPLSRYTLGYHVLYAQC